MRRVQSSCQLRKANSEVERPLTVRRHLRPRRRRIGSLAPWRLRRACDFLTANLSEALRLEAVAAYVGLSAKHFARFFKRSTGLSPHQWLIARRIERAMEMLRLGSCQIAEIALACGFADQSHFSASFRRVVGTTPGRWRRQHGLVSGAL